MAAPSPVGRVLERLSRPYEPSRAVAAMLGLGVTAARQVVGAAIATSPHADRLLDGMPRILRSLAIATTDRPERCYGELRGPVLWSETMSARSASAGDPGLYVCATTSKAYDTHENRALKGALSLLARAGHDAEHGHELAEDVVRAARANGVRAARFCEHQTLATVASTRLTPRVLGRTRAGSRRGTYRPALDLIAFAADPLDATDLDRLLDHEGRGLLALLADVLDELDRAGTPAGPLHSMQGTLEAGPVCFRHPGHAGEGEVAGVTVAGEPVTTAAGAAQLLARAR